MRMTTSLMTKSSSQTPAKLCFDQIKVPFSVPCFCNIFDMFNEANEPGAHYCAKSSSA